MCLSSGLLHTQARVYAKAEADVNADLRPWEPLLRKCPRARQRLPTGFQGARSRGVLCRTEHVTHKFLSVGLGQSAVLTFPLCPRTQ